MHSIKTKKAYFVNVYKQALKRSAPRLPKNAEIKIVEGGNHRGFASYTWQPLDWEVSTALRSLPNLFLTLLRTFTMTSCTSLATIMIYISLLPSCVDNCHTPTRGGIDRWISPSPRALATPYMPLHREQLKIIVEDRLKGVGVKYPRK